MLVYRLEDDSEMGPWRTHKRFSSPTAEQVEHWQRINQRCVHGGEHPVPHDDFDEDLLQYMLNQKWVCGCESLDQFWHWFEDDWTHLGDLLTLRVYQVPDEYVEVGSFQVMYDPTRATEVTVIEPDEYMTYFIGGNDDTQD